jgi:hydroxymethylglutaryl-CoA lyase
MDKEIKIIECPRDAMQGIETFIDTQKKIEYINKLLQVGFDTIDFGSFVSAKAIPQLRDTEEVLKHLKLSETNSKLLAIVANTRGAEDASKFNEIDYLGFPFSVSETFQLRNTNSTIEQSLTRVEEIQNICHKTNKKLVVYLSMGFGNPYGDKWNPDIVISWAEKLKNLDVSIMALSDTVGVSNRENINLLFKDLIPEFPSVEFGAHLHSTPQTAKEKISAVLNAGCYRIDAAIHGFGGCPMATDDLTGNIATETLLETLADHNFILEINQKVFVESMAMADTIFPKH